MLTVTSPQTVDQELGFKGKSTDTKPTHDLAVVGGYSEKISHPQGE